MRVNEFTAAPQPWAIQNVQLKGQYAFITDGILHLAGIDLNAERARDALQKAIDPDKLRVAISPRNSRAFNPSIDEVSFIDDKRGNWAGQRQTLCLNIHPGPRRFTEMIKDLIDKESTDSTSSQKPTAATAHGKRGFRRLVIRLRRPALPPAGSARSTFRPGRGPRSDRAGACWRSRMKPSKLSAPARERGVDQVATRDRRRGG